jgi:hypothetical protein
MLLVDGAGLPLSIDIDSASPAEVTLIEPLLDEAVTPFAPDHLIYDRAADSDPLRERLANRNIELICPHRRGRKRLPTQAGLCAACAGAGSPNARSGGCKPSAA